jgi:hypothetical protein
VVVRDFEYVFDKETDRLCTTKRSELKFEAIEQNSSQRMTIIIQRVLTPNPSLLDKKLLVIPQCTGKHWSAVFIFNASVIKNAQSQQCSVLPECLRPCFFRYCSICSTHNIHSLHCKTNNTTSDLEFDDAKYFNGFPIEELNNLTEREVDNHIRRFSLGVTVVQRKGYELGSRQWATRLLVEAEEQNNEELGSEDTEDEEEESVSDDGKSLDRIEKVDYF